MYGLFFEDINFAADGGLYAEMIKNRSFDFKHPFTGWNVFGDVVLMNDENSPFINNPNYIRLNSSGHRHKHTGVENEGFFGIAVKKGESDKFYFWGKTSEREKPSKVRMEIDNSENNPFVTHSIDIDSDQWHKYEWTFDSKRTFADCTLRVFLESDNGADLEHISMFPAHTYKWREGGLREDLATALDDINPGVFRFPGGCIVEGTDLATRYDWKKSLGPVENRQVNENRWNYTFSHRMYPDYFQTDRKSVV